MLSKETIMQELNKVTDKLKQKYDEKYIFGVFVIGMANYNLADDISELKYIMIKLPTFEELCLSIPQVYFDEKYPNVEIADWNVFYQYAIEQNNIVMQCMFTDYYIINSRYSKYYETQMKNNAELIYHLDEKKRLQSAQQMALNLLEECELEHNFTGLKAMEAARLDIAIDLYVHGTPCEDCVKLNKSIHLNYLSAIKQGQYDINPIEIRDNMTAAIELCDNTYNKKADKAIQKIIIDILKMSITKDVDETQFLKSLTTKEKQALDALVDTLDNGEGNISLVKMTEKAGISRPVFMGLIQKMKDHKVAEIKNMGVKGTYFHILNQNLLS